MYIYVYTLIRIHINTVFLCVYTYVRLHTCILMCIHIYTFAYIHIYHTYIFVQQSNGKTSHETTWCISTTFHPNSNSIPSPNAQDYIVSALHNTQHIATNCNTQYTVCSYTTAPLHSTRKRTLECL